MPGPGLELVGDEEIAEIVEVLRNRELSRYRFDDGADGTDVSKVLTFERELAALTGVRHCLGTNSCTSALLAGLLAGRYEPGAEVIVPGYTFIASIASIGYAGLTPVLAEVDESLTLDPADVARKVTDRTVGVMAVHMLGAPADLDALRTVCDEHGLDLFEDCAQAGGATYKGRHVGGFGTFGAFSLNVFKTFTAGDGGVLLTDDDELFERAFAIHDHGAAPYRAGVRDTGVLLGLNLRMHELTGAVALAQVRKLPGLLDRLRARQSALRAAIGEPAGVRERRLPDPSGDCGTTLTYLFDREEHAKRVAAELGTITLSGSGRHNYVNMGPVRAQALPPTLRVRQPDLSRFAAGVLPRTDDLLSRAITLSVGVSDSYLGASFGIRPSSEPDEIAAAAEHFVDVVERLR
ncbi:DegT/DnrJ/EryC1/StrS family aminotransferase [Rugosimonospora africana]|uniref:dTDP-4-amino-4,6-dideoxygalactose transaminase n=1 Tax=Rugosimonospora africana TaxID=556532 RepID=A0A8J3QIS5_9ACTN|nr:DegT/DnrJ/EryC1/StrS family aminotransferase [Rugosimonospora africana]GIH11849.1 hypothetical protein Raf01_00210 [Rugosimonospora africana]